jgi:hypothetical protein
MAVGSSQPPIGPCGREAATSTAPDQTYTSPPPTISASAARKPMRYFMALLLRPPGQSIFSRTNAIAPLGSPP